MDDTIKEKKPENPNRFPIGTFFAWKARDVSVAAVTVVCGYLTIFCTDTLGMPAALVGTLIMASKIFDGVTDLFAAYIVENTHTRLGKARPYEFCMIGLWGATILMFHASPEWSMTVKSVWIFAMYTFVFSIFQTLVGAGQTPYMIRAFANRNVITKVASFGGIVTMMGSIVVAVTFPQMMEKLAGSPGGWRTMLLMYGFPLMAIGLLRLVFVKEKYDIDGGKTPHVSIKMVLTMFRTNGWAWVMAAMMGCFNLVINLNVQAYYFKHIVGNYRIMGFLQIASIAMLSGMFFMPLLTKRFSVASIIACSSLISAAGYALLFIAVDNIILLAIGGLFAGIANLPLAYLLILIIMDVSTFNEYKGLPRMETSVSVVSNFTSKVFAACGAAMAGFLLGAAKYDGTAHAQPASALLMIRLLYSVVPCLGFVLTAFIASRLNILSKKMPEISKEVAAKKAASEQ